MSRIGQSMIRGLERALAIASGTAKKGTYVVHIPPEIDIKAIRGRLGMTQQEFANRFDFNINTLPTGSRAGAFPTGRRAPICG
jgi:putative transcriptional regulator